MNSKIITSLPFSATVLLLAIIGLVAYLIAGLVPFKNPLAAAVALFSTLLVILKADSDYQKRRESERNSQRFDMASKSHMATAIFDRQLAFSEEYYGIASRRVVELFDWDFNDYNRLKIIVEPLYEQLIECRIKHGIFLTEELQQKLAQFESRIKTMCKSIETVERIGVAAQNAVDAAKRSSAVIAAKDAYIELFGSQHRQWRKALEELQELIGISFLTETRRQLAGEL
jgi:hypothetical protein